MGILNPSDYTITPHASEQIRKRFGQTLDTMRKWTERLLNLCEFVRHEESGRERYRYQDIAIILDTKKKQVITMFPDPQDAIKLERQNLNPELQISLNEMVDDFLEKKRQKLANTVSSKMPNIDKAVNDFNITCSEDNLSELRSVLSDINDDLEKYDMFVAETRIITRK